MNVMDTSSTGTKPDALWRTRGAVVASLCAAALAAGGVSVLVSAADSDPDGTAASAIDGIVPSNNPRVLSGPAWVSAEPGTCLTWSLDGSGEVTSFYDVPCDDPHWFEVAGRVDLTEDPDYPQGTPIPSAAELRDIREEHCSQQIEAYAPGHPIDPEGRFAPTVVPPSEEGWDAGDRTLLCGLTTNELDGSLTESTGNFVEADQHRLWEPGTCLGFTDERLPGAPTDCEEDHAIEIVSTLDIAPLVDEAAGVPDPTVQAEVTNDACRQAGIDYVGGEEELRQTTLISILVTPIREISWETGSRTVNCGLMRADADGQFEVLNGSPTTGNLTVGGAPPVPPTTTTVPLPEDFGGDGELPVPAEPTEVPSGAGAAGGGAAGGGTGFGP